MGEGCRGEEGGATGGGEGRPVAAAPRDGEVEGEAAAAKAEGREALLNTELLASFGCAWARRVGSGARGGGVAGEGRAAITILTFHS